MVALIIMLASGFLAMCLALYLPPSKRPKDLEGGE